MSGREAASSRRALPGSACVFPIADTLSAGLIFLTLWGGQGARGPRRLLNLRVENPLSAWIFKWKGRATRQLSMWSQTRLLLPQFPLL